MKLDLNLLHTEWDTPVHEVIVQRLTYNLFMFSPHIHNNPASTFWTDDTNGEKKGEKKSRNDVGEMQFMAMCALSNL